MAAIPFSSLSFQSPSLHLSLSVIYTHPHSYYRIIYIIYTYYGTTLFSLLLHRNDIDLFLVSIIIIIIIVELSTLSTSVVQISLFPLPPPFLLLLPFSPFPPFLFFFSLVDKNCPGHRRTVPGTGRQKCIHGKITL